MEASRSRPLLLAAMLALPIAQAAQSPVVVESHENDDRVVKYTAWTWAILIAAMIIYRWTNTFLQYVRRLANLNSSDGRQRFFSIPDERWAMVKRHLVSAPLLKTRHHREFMLSEAVNVGTLPGRLQTLFLLGYLALNITFCAWSIDWHASAHDICSMGRNRTGILATMNMIPLFLLAGRNNPLIWLLGVSFDTYNLIHRWIGRIVVLEAVAHTAFFIASQTVVMGAQKGWAVVAHALAKSQMLLTGTIATFAFIVILLQSPSIVRHAFYETFLHVHIVLAFLSVVTIWIHLNGIAEQSLLLAAVVFWIFERSMRLFLIIRNGWGSKSTRADIEALPGDALRVTLRMARPWNFKPGQHVFLYIPGIGMWTSHPFSLAWSESGAVDLLHGLEKPLPLSRQDILPATSPPGSTLSLIIRRRTGFTDALYRAAEADASGRLTRRAYVEGPYGGHQSFDSYGTVMLFAAGVGITHQVPHVRELIAAYANGTAATRKVVLIWIIQSPEHLEWIRPWMTQILGMEKRREILKILLFVTKPRSTKEIHSPSASVQMFPGRPDIAALVAKEQSQQVGAMAVSVCGTGSLSDDVRKAALDRCEETEIDFFEEAFSW